MVKKLTIIEQKKMFAERLARFGLGRKHPVAVTGGGSSPLPKKRATGIVIREPQQVVRTPHLVEHGRVHRAKQDVPHPVDVPHPTTQNILEAPPTMSSIARDASSRIEETGETALNLNDPNEY